MLGEANITVQGTDSSGTKANASCLVTVNGVAVGPNDPPLPALGKACFPPGLDGINLLNGESWKFWINRISGACEGLKAICNDGVLIDSTGLIFDQNKYKYRSCVSPNYKEF